MSRSAATDSVLVPLVDRFRWTMAARLVLAIAVPAIGYAMPRAADAPGQGLLLPAAAVLLFVLAASPLPRLGRRPLLAGLTMGLLLDGCYLAWGFHVLQSFDGLAGYLVVVHAMSVTLLTSFRSGLKFALWQTLLLVVVLQAEVTGLLDGATTGEPFPSRQFGVLVGALWTATLATAAFAALNERELRRRRYDAEVLRRFAVDLEVAGQTTAIAERLAHLGHDDLLAARSVVLCFSGSIAAADTAMDVNGHRGGVAGVIARVGGGEPVVSADPLPLPPQSVAVRALGQRRTELVTRLDPQADGYLAGVLPDARNLAVVPFASEHEAQGVLVLEFADRADPSPISSMLGAARGPRIERRAVATAEQAAAHAALAFGRTALMLRLKAAANLDGLTGIANRRMFDDVLGQELRTAERSGTPCAVALIDLDHFKQLNDRQGHLAGDEALRVVAKVLESAARPGDTVARYGGEEFVVIMRDTGIQDALDLAEHLRGAIAVARGPVPVTASIGVAASPAHGTDPATLLQSADGALYRAKADGRNQVRAARTTPPQPRTANDAARPVSP